MVARVFLISINSFFYYDCTMYRPSLKLIPLNLANLALALTVHYLQGTEADKEINSHQFSEEQKNWWAVQPLQPGKIDGLGNQIDFFIQKKLNDKNLTLAVKAGPYEFIRRANYDLLGLPPTPDEIDAFVQSWEKDSRKAKRNLIECLLGDRAGQPIGSMSSASPNPTGTGRMAFVLPPTSIGTTSCAA